MNRSRFLPIAFILGACFAPTIATATTVFQCKDSSGRRTAWVDVATQCPSGSTAFAYSPPNICVIPGVCVTGTPPGPAELGEWLCCAFVSGDSACHWVNAAFDCPPDQFLASCDWGVSESDGTVTCYD